MLESLWRGYSITPATSVFVTLGLGFFFFMSRGRRWVFTINNYTDADVQRLDVLGSSTRCNYLVFGFEVASTTNTRHLQGFAIFSEPHRLSQLRSHLSDRGHYELARGTSEQASLYCKKDGDFKEYGSLPRTAGSRSDLDAVVVWGRSFAVESGRPPTSPEVAREFPLQYTKFNRITRTLRFCAPAVALQHGDLRDWQRTLKDVLMEPADDRTVRFYVDVNGGSGKSWFSRWMVTNYADKVQLLGIGKRDDMCFAVEETKSIFLLNVPRGQMEFLQYAVLEMLKDRVVTSNKYASRTKFLYTQPHVVVFSNEEPDREKMSEDRYAVINL